MKIKLIIVSMLAALALTGCAKDKTGPVDGEFDTAYLTIQIAPQVPTRASTELQGSAAESTIGDLYIVTFDSSKTVIKHSQATSPYIHIVTSDLTTNPATNVSTTNDAFKVSPSVKYVLMVANPGPLMLARLNAMIPGSTTYANFNEMIVSPVGTTGANRADRMADEIRKNDNTYFAMINAGGIYNATPGAGENSYEDCLVDVSGNIVLVSSTTDDATAQQNAKDNRAELTIERLAAKVEVTVGDAVKLAGTYSGVTGAATSPDGHGLFLFQGWEFDHRNSMFFPYALKNTTADTHTAGIYTNNFYTVDPNYLLAGNDYLTGIVNNDLDGRAPNFTWNAENGYDYAIENTMEAQAQKYGGTTILVIQAQYAPMSNWTLGADWFSYGTTVYENLATVQAAYAAATPGSGLITACDNFLTQVNNVLTAMTLPTAANFAALDQTTHLDPITNGGEICKIEDCLLWYDGGVNYYFYKIRHDRSSEEDMYFGKFGIVRNNWYKLNLTSVAGKGTPWYPGGGPGDPDPGEDNDEGTARLAFEITVGPWVYWTNDFGI